MNNAITPGAIPYPEGSVTFGPGSPTLCVNDQCGYLIEQQDVQEKLLKEDFSPLIELARDGKEKGFHIFNVQLMAPSLIEEEERLFPQAVEAVYKETGCGIAVDTKNPRVLEKALAQYPYRTMCNCITGERKSLEEMIPIIAEYGGVVGTAIVDEEGIPQTVEGRMKVGSRVVEAAEKHGIAREDVALDAVCFAAGAVPDSMRVALQTLRSFKEELGVPTLLGISNAGFMMPRPSILEISYFIAAVSWGMDVAMISPYTPQIEWFREAMDFLMGIDPYASSYLRLYRESGKGDG